MLSCSPATPVYSGPYLLGSSSVPPTASNGNARDVTLALQFDSSLEYGASGSITLYDDTTGSVAETWDIADTSKRGTGDGQINLSGSRLTLNPSQLLTQGTKYSVLISAGALTNIDKAPAVPIAAVTDHALYRISTKSVTLALSTSTIKEAGGSTTLTATLDAPVSTETEVVIAVAGSAAPGGTTPSHPPRS